MKAFRLLEWGRPARLVDVAAPEPGPGQVLLEVTAAGACHSDLHLMEWPEGQLPWRLPFTLGHENAARVAEVGPGVEGLARGDAVLVYGPWGCGRCRPCRLGRENYCERAAEIGVAGGGLGRDGGMAELMLVPSARLLVPLGALDPVQAAPLTDAGLTPYHAIRPSLPVLVPGSSAVVVGVGGLGQMAVQLLKALAPARVIAVDKDRRRLDAARGLGADAVFLADAGAAEEVRRATGGLGAELVLDVVGAAETLAMGAKVLRAEGRLALIGLAGGTLPFGFFGLPYGAQAATSYWGTLPELLELVALAQAGRIRLPVETFPLERAGEAYERLRRGEVSGRAVVVPA
jgi:propanol-preferring alcohol dehydrogenase